MLTLRPATPDDAAELSRLARRTYFETFAADTAPADMALHLDTSYGEAQQRAEIRDPTMATFLAEVDGALAGFAQLRVGHEPALVTTPKPVEIWRFYLDRPWHGKGVAQEMMAACIVEARKRGGESVWLGVWERNFRAIAFYGKCGFVDAGSHRFMVGRDPQTDRVMVRPLSTTNE